MVLMTKNRLSWMIGGAQGTGVDSSANIFTRACAYGGLYVYGKREYYSNIKGEHSYFQVRVSNRTIRSHIDDVCLLSTFDSETIVRHARDVIPQGGIIYDPALNTEKVSKIGTLDKRVIDDTLSRLKLEGLGDTVLDVLNSASSIGVQLYPIPYDDLLKEIGNILGVTQMGTLTLLINTMAVAASFGLLDYKPDFLYNAIRKTFRAKPKVIDMNMKAAEITYNYVRKKFTDGFSYKLEGLKADEDRILIQGTQAVALGKLVGGGRFQSYYPITPAGDESDYLEAHEVLDLNLPQTLDNPQAEESSYLEANGKGGIVVIQTEDEIAAITMATGAALSGARSATSTSGPGFCLMVEGIGWAGMNEVPVVITHYQRGGPSTGLPTRHEQGDLRFVLHAGHGEFPRMILASGDLEECFYDAALAFNYAERYQLPVIHLIDKALANSSETTGIFDSGRIKIERGLLLSEEDLTKLNEPYLRFKFTESGISPRVALGTRGGTFWNTGDEHNESGHITEDPILRIKMMEKRMGKIEVADREIPGEEKINFFGDRDADITLISWGSTKGPILDAMDLLRAEGHSLNFLQIRLLNPLPKDFIAEVLAHAKKIIDVEMNFSSQLAGVIREKTGIYIDHRIVKYNGRPFSQNEIYDSVKKIIDEGTERIICSQGV
jgi:2-oxoglutarate ferredoxin oxidoreductase subunit alpha